MGEYYLLDESLRRDSVIEGFISMIWTERFNTAGEFQLDIPSTPAYRAKFQDGVKIARGGSQYFMVTDTVQDYYDENEARRLKLTGKTYENVLDSRVAMNSFTGLATTPKWVITDTPGNVMRAVFKHICVDCALNAGDFIPYYHTGTLNPAGSFPEPTIVTEFDLDPGSVYSVLTSIASTYNLGFRLVKDGDTGNVYFEIYTGNDRTTGQRARTPVVFSEDLDNMSQRSSLKSSATKKTVAYVFAQNGTATVYAPTTDTINNTGLDRQVLYVDASDIETAAGTTLQQQLNQRGLVELNQNAEVYAFDGSVPSSGGYAYGTDYALGDIVEEQDETGFGNRMRVTEQIFTSDDTGEQSYPTLEVDIVVVPGTWSAYSPATDAWSQVPTTEHWADEPTT